MEFFPLFIIGLLLGGLSIIMAEKIWPRLGLLDFPERYGLNRKPKPYPAGILIVLLSLGLGLIDTRFLVLLGPILVLGVVSFLDDRYQVGAIYRLLLQIAVGVWIFYQGIAINVIGHPFEPTNIELVTVMPWMAFGLTIFWVVALQNAMNWFDGLPGLSVGVSAIGFLALGLLGLIRPELFLDPAHGAVTQAHFYLAGVCVGMWWLLFKERLILGDTGSQVLGLLLAAMSIFAGAKIATTALVLMLPFLDLFLVVLRRALIDKKSPFKGDYKHLHHLLAQQFGREQAVLVLLVCSFVFGVLAVLLSGLSKAIALLVLLLLLLGAYVWIWKYRPL